jgi:deferrochelatase/peroxidase EfeB
VVGAGLGQAIGENEEEIGGEPSEARTTVPFRGERQAGVTTIPQEHLYFASFDLTTNRLEVSAGF